MTEEGTYVAASGRELFRDEVRERALDLLEGVHGHVKVNMWLYGATQRPACK